MRFERNRYIVFISQIENLLEKTDGVAERPQIASGQAVYKSRIEFKTMFQFSLKRSEMRSGIRSCIRNVRTPGRDFSDVLEALASQRSLVIVANCSRGVTRTFNSVKSDFDRIRARRFK